jgi:hypothetical protein
MAMSGVYLDPLHSSSAAASSRRDIVSSEMQATYQSRSLNTHVYSPAMLENDLNSAVRLS